MTIQKLEPENPKHAGLLGGEIAVSCQPAASRLLIFAFRGWSSANPHHTLPPLPGRAWLTWFLRSGHCGQRPGLQLDKPLVGRGELSFTLSHGFPLRLHPSEQRQGSMIPQPDRGPQDPQFPLGPRSSLPHAASAKLEILLQRAACPGLRAFALAVSSAWNTCPQMSSWPTLLSLCPDVTFSMTPALAATFKSVALSATPDSLRPHSALWFPPSPGHLP